MPESNPDIDLSVCRRRSQTAIAERPQISQIHAITPELVVKVETLLELLSKDRQFKCCNANGDDLSRCGRAAQNHCTQQPTRSSRTKLYGLVIDYTMKYYLHIYQAYSFKHEATPFVMNKKFYKRMSDSVVASEKPPIKCFINPRDGTFWYIPGDHPHINDISTASSHGMMAGHTNDGCRHGEGQPPGVLPLLDDSGGNIYLTTTLRQLSYSQKQPTVIPTSPRGGAPWSEDVFPTAPFDIHVLQRLTSQEAPSLIGQGSAVRKITAADTRLPAPHKSSPDNVTWG
ncbi:hypothetical protein Bbelb_400370 [Branchiostoma belcheri]|nr:hypothetical protein Bbelb_400370 [Branchiostoma belcheri]